mmetsp:Transcript_28946/g.76368  ORF Transcript_28946/g.76368 Transcript_28946/m.76368 type:complete len:101 (-) Transcript_28946:180-482(-)
MARCFSRVGWSLVSGKHKELASRVASKLSPVSSRGEAWLGRARLGRDLEEEFVEEAVRRYLASQVMSRTGVGPPSHRRSNSRGVTSCSLGLSIYAWVEVS